MALPVYHIVVPTKEYEKLSSDIWSNTFVNAVMSIGGKEQSIRLRYRGGHTRGYIKKSFEIRTISKTYHFNAEYDDPSLLRNALSFRYFESIGVPAPSTQHCVLYMNGEPMGVYLRIESVKMAFFRKRNIPVSSIYYAVNDQADFSMDSYLADEDNTLGYYLIKGTSSDQVKLHSFIRELNQKSKLELLQLLHSRVDTDNYLRWLCGAVLTGNYDGFHQNYTLFESKKHRKYGMIPWDYEGTWGRNCYGTRVDSNMVRIQGYNKLTGKLLAYRVFRQQYKKLMRKYLIESFTEKRIMPMINRMHKNIANEVHQDPYYRWHSDVFASEPEIIRDYVVARRCFLKEELAKL
ncbi:CotH kinase family protein [Paenibacillus sp. Marseille-Q4541]|uniref:CotH kinase family protein n=1 Tax=Paenibacillus sp. Marseille-Q4541 TaxID=2831522 RepID=UPI001BA45822|nr:CotH kinase family protein [Paenibacillus sp. Marseille-Q4541]